MTEQRVFTLSSGNLQNSYLRAYFVFLKVFQKSCQNSEISTKYCKFQICPHLSIFKFPLDNVNTTFSRFPGVHIYVTVASDAKACDTPF